jgi:signal transduction histidine kinase
MSLPEVTALFARTIAGSPDSIRKGNAASIATAFLKIPEGADANVRRRGLATATVSLLLAALIFVVDSFTDIESAIAVFYVIVVILAAGILTRFGIILTASMCGGLSIVSYLVAHGVGDDLSTLLRLAGALSALAITTALLLRNDIIESDLVASHEETRKSEVRYRSIFQQSRVALWEQDISALKRFLDELKAEGIQDLREHASRDPGFVGNCAGLIRTTALNRAALELLGGKTQDQASGTVSRFIHDDDPCFFKLVIALFEGQRRFESKGRLRDLNGNETVILLALEFPETDIAFQRVVVGLVDITQRETTQAALMAAQSELARASRVTTVGALSASIAHELNQPLAALVMNAEASLRWLDRDPPDVSSAITAVERLMRDGHRTSDIIKTTRSLLARKPTVAEPIDLVPLVRETKALMAYELDKNGVDFRFAADTKTPRVAAATTELQQVLINLLTNAIQAMAGTALGTKSVTITIAPAAEGFVRIGVKDSGPGIGRDEVEKLFEPFYTTKQHGVGIGLAICKSTIESRGGRMTASHRSDGALFEIFLPAVPEVPDGDDIAPGRAPSTAGKDPTGPDLPYETRSLADVMSSQN